MEVSTDLLISLDKSLSKCGKFNIDIRELTITQIQEHFRTGKLTSVDLTKCYLNRISKIDIHLKSVIEVNPDAISLAKRADKERSAGLNQNPLHGIPILIKDNIATADLMHTTAGALVLENVKPIKDADVVKRLRKAGAVILGKANLSEWANFRDDDIPSGWSGRGGQTVCPYVMGADPHGSSTGSAVSVAANLAMISLGTETDGSIITPSTSAAIVGLKPTLGSVSTRGVIPLAFSNDTVGPMARSAADVAILLAAISDIDLQGCDVDISSCLSDQVFKIGVPRDTYWDILDPSIEMEILENCLANLNKLAKVIHQVTCPEYVDRNKNDNEMTVLKHEFKYSLNKYLKNDVHPDEKIRTLTDIIKFNELNPPKECYNQNNLKMCDKTDGVDVDKYIAARDEMRRNSVKYLDSILNENPDDPVDALIVPSFTMFTYSLYSHAACSGYPSITVPIGIDEIGMPFSLHLVGRPNSEAVLLKLAFFIESSRPNQRPVPLFIKSQQEG